MNTNTDRKFYARGKLLLTGEYFVLDGALALALPCRLGQTLQLVEVNSEGPVLDWMSVNANGDTWFRAQIDTRRLTCVSTTSPDIGSRLETILKAAVELNSSFLHTLASPAVRVVTNLEFDRNWGLGSSSTLIVALAKWAGVDPFALQERVFGGSGYDIACALAHSPILYRRSAEGPEFIHFPFTPLFRDQLYFVYLQKKQNSRQGIARYRQKVGNRTLGTRYVSDLTRKMMSAVHLHTFEEVLRAHEDFISLELGLDKAKDLYFADYWGEVKSLGAWGGDFVMVTSNRSPSETRKYFLSKGYPVVLRFQQLVCQ